jgi:Uma2 family endonuclease
MDEPVKKNATYDDLVDLPENVVGEIIGGHLYATPRPRARHAFLAGALSEQVRTGFGRHERGESGWWILPEPELHLGADVLVPDLAAWRRVRMPEFPSDAPWIALAPDWVCEILSPSTTRRDRVQKLPIYARAGVGYAWLIDPVARTLEVLRLDGGRWTLASAYAGSERGRPEPFAGHEFDRSEWWP